MNRLFILVISFCFLSAKAQSQDKAGLLYLVHWSKQIHNNENYCKYLIEYVNTYGADTNVVNPAYGTDKASQINYCAWQLFKNTSDTSYLRAAEVWTKPLLLDNGMKKGPFLDTYANIIYKLGRNEEAIVIEQKALDCMPDTHMYAIMRESVAKTLSKMKAGLNTW